MPITRRQLLVGGAGLAGVGVAARLLSDSGYQYSGTVGTGTFTSKALHGTNTGWTINWPAGHAHESLRPLIVLHGRGGDHTTAFLSLHLDHYLRQAVSDGTPAFALASVDGGDHSYWHPRAAGDTAAMVIDEFVPLLSAHGLDTSRVGFLGWSMGGYGALYLASVLGSSRVAAAVAESPAIWHESYQSAAGAFDDAADFDKHALFGRQRLLNGIALRVDCGASDGFAPVTRDLRASLHPTPAGGIEPGNHDADYWRSQALGQLTFVGKHLPKH
jgi:enterochelin esterase-like enzyme